MKNFQCRKNEIQLLLFPKLIPSGHDISVVYLSTNIIFPYHV